MRGLLAVLAQGNLRNQVSGVEELQTGQRGATVPRQQRCLLGQLQKLERHMPSSSCVHGRQLGALQLKEGASRRLHPGPVRNKVVVVAVHTAEARADTRRNRRLALTWRSFARCSSWLAGGEAGCMTV